MIEQIIEWDKELFLFLNGMHSTVFDFIMYWLSDKLIWIPFYLFLLYLIIKQFRMEVFYILIAAAVLITLSDMSSVHLFKNIFKRLRPCHNQELADMVHLVKGKCGGSFGFVSSHAANTFALAFFLIKILGKIYFLFTPFILLWAFVVSYSRIYLGVHYPSDVLCGAILGAVIGVSIGKAYWVCRKHYLCAKIKTD